MYSPLLVCAAVLACAPFLQCTRTPVQITLESYQLNAAGPDGAAQLPTTSMHAAGMRVHQQAWRQHSLNRHHIVSAKQYQSAGLARMYHRQQAYHNRQQTVAAEALPVSRAHATQSLQQLSSPSLYPHSSRSSQYRRSRNTRRQLLLLDAWQVGSDSDSYSTGHLSSGADSSHTSSSRSIAGAAVGPPVSCIRNSRYSYLHLRVLLEINLTSDADITDLEAQASAAAARQLDFLDSSGQLDTDRVECYVDTGASWQGNVWLDFYVWLSALRCEVAIQVWQNLVSSQPAALFAQDQQLAAAVRNVTVDETDPAKSVKMAIQNSANRVDSITISGAGTDDSSSSAADSSSSGAAEAADKNDTSSDNDYIALDGTFFMTPFNPGANFTGLVVMGITTVCLFMVVALMVIVQKWVEWRAGRRAAAAVAARVAEATALAQAALAGATAAAAVVQVDGHSATGNSSRSSSGTL